MLTAMLLLIFFACVAALWNEGFWSNTITVINVTLAVIIAVNYYERAALAAEGVMPGYTYVWDYLCLWGLFFVAFSVLRAFTDTLSKIRVRFKVPVEHVGRVVAAMWVAWILVGFTCLSLHTAPLARHPMGFAKTPTSNHFVGLAPDRQWLALMRSRSRGALKRWTPRPFDPDAEFVFRYHQRRANLEDYKLSSGGDDGHAVLRVQNK